MPVTTALALEAEASRPFFVNELKTPQERHLAFAAAASGKNGTFIAYAEEPLRTAGSQSLPGRPLRR